MGREPLNIYFHVISTANAEQTVVLKIKMKKKTFKKYD